MTDFSVVITQNIDSQVVPVSTSNTYGTPVSASVTGTEGATTYVYDGSSPYTSGSFYIDNVSGGTNNNDGTVTPTTPSSAAGTTMTYDVNYLSNSGSANTISFTHRVSVSLDGQTGPGVVHTGVWPK